MERSIFQHIVDVINDRRTWISAELCPEQMPYLDMTDGNISVHYSSTIALTVLIAQNGYRKRHRWSIPEFVIEKTARKIKATDKAFWVRLIHSRMEVADVERLIKDSTYGLVNLELDDY